MKLLFFIFISFILIPNFGTQEKKSDILFEIDNYKFPYNLQKCNAIYKLPDKLHEISGLSFYKKNELATIQDEKGNIYFFNLKTGKLSEKIDFAGDGDYEGIAVVENQIWVLKSNGNLFRVKYSKKETETKVYKTDLSSKNDTEGLAYDKKNNRLLIACKGHPYIEDKKGKNKKAIYSFELDEKKLSKNPVFIIDLKHIKELKNYNMMTNLGIDFLTNVNPSKGDVSFQPSRIAIHPRTKNIYLLGTVGKLLIVCNNKGEILAAIELNPDLFIQPEGICFDQSGNLFISNEGRELVPTILKFNPK
jgi:uncharacterized protein YjiK